MQNLEMTKNNEWIKNSFAWKWVKYWRQPTRPIDQELGYIKGLLLKMMQKGAKPQVMILGSTSEYRDLLIDLGLRGTIVDFSKENYHILSQKMKHRDHYQNYEYFVKQPWQKIKIDRKFNLVLGHFVLGINPLNQWSIILKNVKRQLKNNGAFLTTSWVRLNNEKSNLKQVVNEYKKKWEEKYSLWEAMTTKIYLTAYNLAKEYMAYEDLCKVIEEGYKQGLISQKDYKYYLNCGFKEFDFKLVIPLQKKALELFNKYFPEVKIIYFKDYPSYLYMPLFALKK